jgi:uncharacterized MAPEG superfamily protein
VQTSASPILLYAIAAAFVLVYLPFLVVAYERVRVGSEALRAPRSAAVIDKLPPQAQRATWAHQNSFESFTLFTAAALMAYVTQQNSVVAIGAAIAYLVARLLFSVFYILDVSLGRSLMFAIGSVCIITLMGMSLVSVSHTF